MAELRLDILENLKEIQLCPNHPEWLVKIGTKMDLQIKGALIDYLIKHQHTSA